METEEGIFNSEEIEAKMFQDFALKPEGCNRRRPFYIRFRNVP